MSILDQYVVPAILDAIRARRRSPGIQESNSPHQSVVSGDSPKLREAQFSDYDAVTELKRRWNLTADSFENWERIWKQNPALAKVSCERPMGWVLETGAGVVGYLGNISSTYYQNDETLNVVTSSALVVEPAYRSMSLSLVAAFYRQKSVDIFQVTTAIPAVGKISRSFNSDPLPQAEYEKVLFWVLEPYAFAQEVAKKLGIRPALVKVAGFLGSLALRIEILLRSRKPKRARRSFSLSQIRIDQIGEEFQSLWKNKLSERPRLLAERSPCALKWHYQIPGDNGATSVLCCHEQNRLRGYAIIRTTTGRMNSLKHSLVADMLVESDDPEIIRALLLAARDHAKQRGSHVLEVLGFPSNIRQVCLEGHPYSRRYPACPYYYKASDTSRHKTLSDSSLWYATPYDGDTTLMP